MTYYVVDKLPLPSIGHTISEYDQAKDAILNEPNGDTIRVTIEGKTPQQIYNGILPRITEYNNDPKRTYDLIVAQRKPDIYLSRTQRKQA